MSKMKIVKMPRMFNRDGETSTARRVAEALLETKGKKWWTPCSQEEARAAQILRTREKWPIEDQKLDGSRRHSYRLDPDRRGHYQFK